MYIFPVECGFETSIFHFFFMHFLIFFNFMTHIVFNVFLYIKQEVILHLFEIIPKNELHILNVGRLVKQMCG